MKAGKAFELLVKKILIHIGFTEVKSDEWYILSNGSSQKIRGLGEVHDADVLLDPPVQTPFYTPTRLLIECKDYNKRVGLNVLRSALGLREDINHFELIDKESVHKRYTGSAPIQASQQYLYQVAVASMSGFTKPAQNFAAIHRISLIEFNKMPFWKEFCDLVERDEGHWNAMSNTGCNSADQQMDEYIQGVIDDIARRSAVAITNSGQMLFLYKSKEDNRGNCDEPQFRGDYYDLTWREENQPWKLRIGNEVFRFQLPKDLLKSWLQCSKDEIDLRINAIRQKQGNLSRMVVYYSCYEPRIKAISINEHRLREALEELQQTED